MRIIIFSAFVFLVAYLFSPVKLTFANEWGIEKQPIEPDDCDVIMLKRGMNKTAVPPTGFMESGEIVRLIFMQ